MNPLLLLGAGVGLLLLFGKKGIGVATANGTPPSSRTPASGFPAGQPMPPVLAPPGSTGNQIGVALAQNSGEIAKGLSSAAVSLFDWARASDQASGTGDAPAEEDAELATAESDEDEEDEDDSSEDGE